MNINEFAIIKSFVTNLLEQYRTVRKECGFADEAWNSRTIERISKPFVSGSFTLAVVGKVSSGKSTFINALLGCKNLLPTGHDQTTCGLTYIEYGEKPEVMIEFGDGHTETFTEGIEGTIKPYVAIAEKYHDLPVNSIDDMILGGFDFPKIWESHKQLEEETLCNRIDKVLLEEYVRNRQIKDIARTVRVKYPFNEELKGWCVIDTPGIGAIGGIEDRTRLLLATQKEDRSRVVDAIVFLQDGSQTLDQTDTKAFVKEQLDSFTDSDKHRLFYVLTYSGSSKFLNHKDRKLSFIASNYGDRINSLTYADSLLYSFLNFMQEADWDLKTFEDFERPDDWEEDDWGAIMEMLFNAKRHLKKSGDAINNETLWRTISEWAHFDSLKATINQFARDEKHHALVELVKLIKKDYHGFINSLSFQKRTVQGDLKEINLQLDNLEKKRKEYNSSFRDIDRKTSIEEIEKRFSFIDERFEAIQRASTINEVRSRITNLFNDVQNEEEALFNDIKCRYEDLLGEIENDLVLESLDLDEIEHKAEKDNTYTYPVSPERIETHFSGPDTKIPAKYDTKKDSVGKLRDFKAIVLRKANNNKNLFVKQVVDKIGFMGELVREELNGKLTLGKEELENLKPVLKEKESFKIRIDALITMINDQLNKLEKYVQDYGL